jgi:hypothetical protein
MLSLIYLDIPKVNKVLKVTIGILEIFANLFIYIGNLGTVLVAKAIIIKIIPNFKLISISKLIIAEDSKLTILAKGIINAVAAKKISVFRAFF